MSLVGKTLINYRLSNLLALSFKVIVNLELLLIIKILDLQRFELFYFIILHLWLIPHHAKLYSYFRALITNLKILIFMWWVSWCLRINSLVFSYVLIIVNTWYFDLYILTLSLSLRVILSVLSLIIMRLSLLTSIFRVHLIVLLYLLFTSQFVSFIFLTTWIAALLIIKFLLNSFEVTSLERRPFIDLLLIGSIIFLDVFRPKRDTCFPKVSLLCLCKSWFDSVTLVSDHFLTSFLGYSTIV